MVENGLIPAAETGLIGIAIEKGLDVESLKALMDLQERFEKREAKKAFTVAMAKFKADPPKIIKDQHVSYGDTSYDHASLSNITQTINSGLARVGLSATWRTNQTDRSIEVTCVITHEMGHSEQTTMKSRPDTSGRKNHIQAIGSAVTYLQRYTLLAMTGLSTFENEDDGKASGENVQPAEPQNEPPPEPEQVPVEKIIDAVDWFPKNNKSIADLDKWILEKSPVLAQLSTEDQAKVYNYVSQIKAVIREDEQASENNSKVVIDC